MRSLTFAAAFATLTLTPSIASAAVLSVGGPLSENCYSAALSGDDRDQAIDSCSHSLQQEALARNDQPTSIAASCS